MISGLQAMAVSRLTLFDVAIEEVRVINTVKKVTFLIILGQVRGIRANVSTYSGSSVIRGWSRLI